MGPPGWCSLRIIIFVTVLPDHITISWKQIYSSNDNEIETPTKKLRFWSFSAIFAILGSFRAPRGPLRGSHPPFLNFYTLLSNIFQTRSFLRFSIDQFWNYKENHGNIAFFEGTLIPLSIPGSRVMKNRQESIFPYVMRDFSQFPPLYILTLHEKMHRWANNLVIPPLLERSEDWLRLR